MHACAGDEYFRVGAADDGRRRCARLRLYLRRGPRRRRSIAPSASLVVGGPTLRLEGLLVGGDGIAAPGPENALIRDPAQRRRPPVPRAAQARLNLLGAELGAVGVQYADVPAIAAGRVGDHGDGGDAARGCDGADRPSPPALELVVSDAAPADYQAVLPATLLVGEIDAGAPCGPDAHGYWALDSADAVDYPDLAPVYRWTAPGPRPGRRRRAGGLHRRQRGEAGRPALRLHLLRPGLRRAIRVSDNGWISFDTDGATTTSTTGRCPAATATTRWWRRSGTTSTPTLRGHRRHLHAPRRGRGHVHHRVEPACGTTSPRSTTCRPSSWCCGTRRGHPGRRRRRDALPLPAGPQQRHAAQFATVRLGEPDETDGLQLTYDNLYAPGAAPLGPGLAVRMTTRRRSTRLTRPTSRPNGRAARSRSPGSPARRPARRRLARRARRDGVADPADAGAAAGGGPILRGRSGARRRRGLPPDRPAPLGHRSAAAPRRRPPTESSPAAPVPVARPAQSGARRRESWPSRCRAPAPRRLRVFDVAGRLVRTLVAGDRPAGEGTAAWDGRDEAGREAPDGVYFCRLESAGGSVTRKLLLVR